MTGTLIARILIGILLLALIFLIVVLLIGPDWIQSVLLHFSNDTLCEDKNQDGVDDFCQYWDNGELTRLEWDTNFDGRVDVWLLYDGVSELFQFDSNHDGRFDYQEIDLPTGGTRVEIDTDFNGTFDRIEMIEG